jgi:hypothetical protein
MGWSASSATRWFRFRPKTRRPYWTFSRRVFDVDYHDDFRGVIDPVAEKKVVDEDVTNLAAIVIDATKIRDNERIRSEFARRIRSFRCRRHDNVTKRSTAESEKTGR